MAQTAVSSAKADWIRRFDGAVTYKEVSFGSPTVRHVFKRTYDQVGRNCHYISVFGRVLLGEAQMSDAEESVYKRAQEIHTAFERKVIATRAVVADAGIEDLAEFSQPATVKAAVIVPTQAKMLKTLSLADEYLRLINTLWLEGEIPDREKSKAELELKQLLRGFFSTTRKMRVYLQGKVTEAQAKGTVSASVKATDGAEDHVDEDTDATTSDEQVVDEIASEASYESTEVPSADAEQSEEERAAA